MYGTATGDLIDGVAPCGELEGVADCTLSWISEDDLEPEAGGGVVVSTVEVVEGTTVSGDKGLDAVDSVEPLIDAWIAVTGAMLRLDGLSCMPWFICEGEGNLFRVIFLTRPGKGSPGAEYQGSCL